MDLSYIVAVHLIFVEARKDAMATRKQVMSAFATAKQRYAEELGVDLRLKKVTKLKRDFSRRQRFSVYGSFPRFAKAFNYTLGRGWWYDNMVKLYVLPGLEAEGKVYAGGIANACKYRTAKDFKEVPPVAVVFSPPAGRINAKELLAITMEHEVGHTICASHDDNEAPPGVMHPAALSFIDALASGQSTGIPDFLRFAPFSINEISKYLDSLK